jgi:hypothetical protein
LSADVDGFDALAELALDIGEIVFSPGWDLRRGVSRFTALGIT